MGWLYHDIHLHYWMAWKQAHVFSPSLGPWVTKGQSKAPQKFHGHPVSWNQLMPLTNHKLRLEQIWRKYEENPHKVKPILAPHFSHIFFSQWSIPSIPTIPSIHSPLSSLHLWIRFCLVIGHQDHVPRPSPRSPWCVAHFPSPGGGGADGGGGPHGLMVERGEEDGRGKVTIDSL